MHDVIIIHRLNGIFTEAKLEISMPIYRQSAKLITNSDGIVNSLHPFSMDEVHSRLPFPLSYKSQIIGSVFEIVGAWSNCVLDNGKRKELNIIYDRGANCAHRDIHDLKIISKLVMNEFKPDGQYKYGFARDDHKGYAIVLDRGPIYIGLWDTGLIELGINNTDSSGNYCAKTDNIANPSCVEVIKDWFETCTI